MIQLQNDRLCIGISPMGAELQSIKDNSGHEYMWQADPQFWPRHSPILFPIVCGLWKNRFRINGDEYPMSRHGFARDMEFSLLKQKDDRVTFVLESNDETYRKYPFHFMLSVTYRLENNKIHIIWHVHNTDTREIHFQIGAHPAFNIPDLQPGEPMHGRLLFDNKGPLRRIVGNIEGCISHEHSVMHTENGIWNYREEDFKEDSLQFDECQLHQIAILDKTDKRIVTIDFKTPCVAVWSPYGKNAPFICIEPWYGVSDHAEYGGEFCDKYLMNHLLPGGSFLSEYSITIG